MFYQVFNACDHHRTTAIDHDISLIRKIEHVGSKQQGSIQARGFQRVLPAMFDQRAAH